MLELDQTISKRFDDANLRLISLGAGVQSSVMALLAERGEFGDIPDGAIFADTQWEPPAVYDHLDWLEDQLSFPVYRVTAGSLLDAIEASTEAGAGGPRFASVPWYFRDHTTAANGKIGMGRRQCTREYKIDPITQETRRLLGIAPRKHSKGRFAEMWIGISTDEIVRMRSARESCKRNRWPLIEARLSRIMCMIWFAREYPDRTLPKSACIGCPYHSDHYWRELKRDDPDLFGEAVKVDHMLRSNGPLGGMHNLQYMHQSCTPLAEFDFGDNSDQLAFSFLDECEGMCGL